MADNNKDDDIYDDPETFGDMDDDIDGASELPSYVNEEDPSESIYLPERDPNDPRGKMDDVDPEENEVHNESSRQDNPEDFDADATHPRQAIPQDEKDSTFDNE